MSFESAVATSGTFACDSTIRNTSDFCGQSYDESLSDCRPYITDANFQIILTRKTTFKYPTNGPAVTTTSSENTLDDDTYTLNNVIFSENLRRWESEEASFIPSEDMLSHNISLFSSNPGPTPLMSSCNSAVIDGLSYDVLSGKSGLSGKWILQNATATSLTSFVLCFRANNGVVLYTESLAICLNESTGVMRVVTSSAMYNNMRYKLLSNGITLVGTTYYSIYDYERWGDIDVNSL